MFSYLTFYIMFRVFYNLHRHNRFILILTVFISFYCRLFCVKCFASFNEGIVMAEIWVVNVSLFYFNDVVWSSTLLLVSWEILIFVMGSWTQHVSRLRVSPADSVWPAPLIQPALFCLAALTENWNYDITTNTCSSWTFVTLISGFPHPEPT